MNDNHALRPYGGKYFLLGDHLEKQNMKPLLNLDEPVQRRSGEPARIIERNAIGEFPVIALITIHNGNRQIPESFTLRGSYASDVIDNEGDLINVPKVVENGTINLRCFLMKSGKIETCEDSISCLQGSADVLGSTSVRVFVKRGSWT